MPLGVLHQGETLKFHFVQRQAPKGTKVVVTCLRLALVQSCERTDLMEAGSFFGTSDTTGVAAGAVRGATDGAAGRGQR